ncbi:hypothetical protein HPB49_024729 [Dermacentor silvarum]|uniref:Uncharacterized protein n=1 Tax=Dermacentor silvarum TaxID=543639 RepID=A0ACB8CCB1_DERSI|nr:hypothetical protein HPB49_024729 [Dermacentor silvarum]
MSEKAAKVTAEYYPPGEKGKPAATPIDISPNVFIKPGLTFDDAKGAGKPEVTTTRQVTPDGIVISRKRENTAYVYGQCLHTLSYLSSDPYIRQCHCARRRRQLRPQRDSVAASKPTVPLHFKASLETETIDSANNITGIPGSGTNCVVHESTVAPQHNFRILSPPPVIETSAVGEAQRAVVTLENEYDIKFPAPPRREPSVRAIGCGSMEEDDFLGNASMVAQTTIILNEGTPGSPGNIIVRRGSSATNLAQQALPAAPMATITLPPTGQRLTTQQITIPPVGPVQVSPPQVSMMPQPQTISHVQQTSSGAQPMATINITSRIRDLTDQVMRESRRVGRARDRLQRRRPAPLNRVYSAEDKLYNLMTLENQLANEIANYRNSGRVRDPEFLSTLAQTEDKLRRLISAENNVARDMRRIKKESFKQETYKVISPRRSITPTSSATSTSMSSYSPPSTPMPMPPMYPMPAMPPMQPPMQPPMMPQQQQMMMMGAQPMMMGGPGQMMMQPGMGMMGGGPQQQQQRLPGPGMYPGLMRISIESPECTCTSFTSSSSVTSDSSDSLPKRKVAKEETKVPPCLHD